MTENTKEELAKLGVLAEAMSNTPLQVPFTYSATPSIESQIENWFTYHAPKDDQPQRYQAIRDKAKELALVIAANTKSSADQTAALRYLRICIMTANASIALE